MMAQKDNLTSITLEYFESQKWRYDVKRNDDERFIAALGMNLKGKLSSCRILVVVDDRDIQCFTTCPIKATEDVRPQVAEFITRANFGLKIGKFELDYNDGEVRYQTILPCSEGVPPIKDVERVVDMGFLMFQRFGDGLIKNLMGFGNPAEDIKAITNQ